MTQYSAGIIGLGFIGAADQVSGDALGQRVEDLDGTHLTALSRNPRIQLIAGSTRDEGRRKRFQERTGCKTFADWREMLARERLDIVSIATYAPTHAEMAVACAEVGVRAIYCEKPVATRLADARRMLASCEQAGALLVINHNRRFNPNYRRLRDLVASGDLGELTSVNLQWGTGRLGNVGTHMIDAMLLLTGRKVQSVSGCLDLTGRPDCRGPAFRDPGGWGMLRLDNGLVATIDAADNARLPARITLNGTLGRASTGGMDVTIDFNDGRRETWPAPGDGRSSMDRAVAEIVAWLDGQRPFSYPASEAVHTLEAILAIHESHDRNAGWVDLPFRGEHARELRSG